MEALGGSAPDAVKLEVGSVSDSLMRDRRPSGLMRSFARRVEQKFAPRRRLARQVGARAHYCRRLGSDLYGTLLDLIALDVKRGGPCYRVMQDASGETSATRLSLRLLAAAHRLALHGRAPALAAHYPSCGGDGDAEGAFPALLEVIEQNVDELGRRLTIPIQRNEVDRSATLLGAFLTLAVDIQLPLRLLELGASAGLNLRWDRYRYEREGLGWGDPTSPLHLPWGGGTHLQDVRVEVVERRGCDLNPLEAACVEDQVTLLSYEWADQVDHLARLRAAFRVAARVPVQIDRADALDWLSTRLAEPSEGAVTVVFHSLLEQQLNTTSLTTLHRRMATAGAAASPRAPLAWIRMERAGGATAAVRLITWPAGRDQIVATATLHGGAVRWLTPGSRSSESSEPLVEDQAGPAPDSPS